VAAVRAALDHASAGLVDRGALVELVGLAAVAGEHLLVLGPPGTAKSEAVRRVARALGGAYFEYLLGRFTEPSEIFGPVDLRKLRDGVVETATAGMLPEAELAFLDEVFLGSTAILNTLLGILNERRFRRGHTSMACPLRVCVGASNDLPEEESLRAFSDRFLLRYFAQPVADPMIEELLEAGWSGETRAAAGPSATVEDLDRLRAASREVRMDGVRPRLADALRQLRGAGVVLSDRRTVKVQRLVAAAAALAGRGAATRADLWPLVFAVPDAADQDRAREVLRRLLEETESSTLPQAAEVASAGPRARAERLRRAGRALLDAGPADGDLEGWRLRLEGVLREIDASTPERERPPELQGVRAELAREVQAGWAADEGSP
jgi:MoxR-like ATPase